MAKILIVLPYSGAQFTGGLAVVNEQLTRALAEYHDVKLLTFELNKQANATQQGHGRAQILFIQSDEAKNMKDPGGRDGAKDRKRLYELINSKDVILGGEVQHLLGNWSPDCILGHSRFSGPAAILLKENRFKQAKVGYFLHSYPPVEGILLTGYEAFEEQVDAESSQQKLKEETDWIYRADVVLAMGPLMRWGATLMLQGQVKQPRVHEVISGVEPCKASDPPAKNAGIILLLSGRASAPVKGFQDIVIAALQLRNADRENKGLLKFPVHIKVRGMNEAKYGERTVDSNSVQEWTDGVFGKRLDSDMVSIEVLDMVPQDRIVAEYQSAHGVLTAAYIEHFGLVPFEALGVGRPVLVSELSGSGQFLASRYDKVGSECVVEDFTSRRRPLTEDVLKGIAADAFDNRPNAWQQAILALVNNIDARIADAQSLSKRLVNDYTIADFAQSVVAAFDQRWNGKITVQIAGGDIEEASKFTGISKL